jgi:hypothetical protein
MIVGMFERDLVDQITVGLGFIKPKEIDKLGRLEVLAEVLCAMRSAAGINAVRDRAARPGEPYASKRRLVKALAQRLENDALPHFEFLLKQKPTPNVVRDIHRFTQDLRDPDSEGVG